MSPCYEETAPAAAVSLVAATLHLLILTSVLLCLLLAAFTAKHHFSFNRICVLTPELTPLICYKYAVIYKDGGRRCRRRQILQHPTPEREESRSD